MALQKTRTFGATLLLAGTSLGAGMFAIPLVVHSYGFVFSEIAVIFIWLYMTVTALLLVEITTSFPLHRNHYISMTKNLLGKYYKMLTWLVSFLLLYTLCTAYIGGDGLLVTAILNTYFHIRFPYWFDSIIFTALFGFVVFYGTQWVDMINRSLISLKVILFFIIFSLLMPVIHMHNLFMRPKLSLTWLAILPFFITAFGFHLTIPSVSNYLNRDKRCLRYAVIIGAVIPMVIYTIWIIMTLGTIPLTGRYSFQMLAFHHSSVDKLILTINAIKHNHIFSNIMNIFANIAMTTSFLGVSLSLFDLVADGFSRENNLQGRAQSAMITFIPPLAVAIFFPHIFVLAIAVASSLLIFLACILPPLMAYKLNAQNRCHMQSFNVYNFFLIGVLLVGLALMFDSIFSITHL